jgi:glycosyltransferase involved in cell wall biosynthesis
MSRLLLDLTHTSHTRARTGIQRVCRSLHTALAARGDGVLAICRDPYERIWRPLRAQERRNLAGGHDAPASARGARWPLRTRLAGWLRRHRFDAGSEIRIPEMDLAGGLVVSEIFSPQTGRALPALLARVAGPRVAVFHDAIVLRLPELSPPKSVGRFPGYLQELLCFDGVAAVSEASRQSLVGYWRWLGVTDPPPVVTLPLGLDAPVPSPYGHTNATGAPPVVLSIGTLEGRKNHLTLLDACETLWQRGLRFELRLIGMVHPQTGRAAFQRVRALHAAGRPVRYDGPASDTAIHAAYRTCVFTVYPSLMEGFGLPVFESLSYGKPCICAASGDRVENAQGGGCIALERCDAPALAAAMERLLSDGEFLAALTDAARARTFKPWPAYADELVSWMRTLSRRTR